MQTGIRDSKVVCDLAQWGFTFSRDRNNITAEVNRIGLRHKKYPFGKEQNPHSWESTKPSAVPKFSISA